LGVRGAAQGVLADALPSVIALCGGPGGQVAYAGLLRVLTPKPPTTAEAAGSAVVAGAASTAEAAAAAAETEAGPLPPPPLAADAASPAAPSPAAPSPAAPSLADPTLAADFARSAKLLPFGVLGQQLSSAGQYRNGAGPSPPAGNVAPIKQCERRLDSGT
jgi:hypothetical protein